MHISIMLVFWFLLRNSVVLAVYLLFLVACFFTVHEHYPKAYPETVRARALVNGEKPPETSADAGEEISAYTKEEASAALKELKDFTIKTTEKVNSYSFRNALARIESLPGPLKPVSHPGKPAHMYYSAMNKPSSKTASPDSNKPVREKGKPVVRLRRGN